MVLNLSNKSKGAISYEKIKYPDGQVSIKIEDMLDTPRIMPIYIKSRFNNYEDLMYILSATDALRALGYESIGLVITCFLAQRSDRRFFPEQSFDLKILTTIINSQNYRSIRVIHPHSDVLPALLNNCKVIDNSEFVDWAVLDVEKKIWKEDVKEIILVSPDAGAYKQVYKHGERLQRRVVTGNKSRDLHTGSIHLDINGDVEGRLCLIVDDYCDGGRTFIQLATKLKEQGAKQVYLLVTHGLFSNGFYDFKDVLDGVYCTNSISDLKPDDTFGYSGKTGQYTVI